VLAVIAVVLGLLASPAGAVTTGVDWGTVGGDIAGGLVGTLTNQLIGSDSLSHGTLVTNAYKNTAGDLFTYEVRVTPNGSFGGISMIGTGFAVAGLTGKAGWSFADAAAAGSASPSTVFEMFEAVNVLQWTRAFDAEVDFWNNTSGGPQVAISFFYQSLFGPNATGAYNFQNSVPGSGVGVSPALRPAAVAEPATLLLLTGGLAGAALWSRWGRRQGA
jgi:hypothetical protein